MSKAQKHRAMNRPVTRRYIEKQLTALQQALISAIVHSHPEPLRVAPALKEAPRLIEDGFLASDDYSDEQGDAPAEVAAR